MICSQDASYRVVQYSWTFVPVGIKYPLVPTKQLEASLYVFFGNLRDSHKNEKMGRAGPSEFIGRLSGSNSYRVLTKRSLDICLPASCSPKIKCDLCMLLRNLSPTLQARQCRSDWRQLFNEFLSLFRAFSSKEPSLRVINGT